MIVESYLFPQHIKCLETSPAGVLQRHTAQVSPVFPAEIQSQEPEFLIVLNSLSHTLSAEIIEIYGIAPVPPCHIGWSSCPNVTPYLKQQVNPRE